jgi:hypothetical protein
MTTETKATAEPQYKLQGIFDSYWKKSHRGENQWLYHVRVDVADPAEAEAKAKELSRREGVPVRVRIEDWNFPRGPHDGFTFSTHPELG